MKAKLTTPLPYQQTNQPTNWPLFFLLPQTRYVRRQRAANSPYYLPHEQPVSARHGAQGSRLTLAQRCKMRITAARMKIWKSVKLAGRGFVHLLVKWYVLPMAVVACLSIAAATPAELPVGYFSEGKDSLIGHCG